MNLFRELFVKTTVKDLVLQLLTLTLSLFIMALALAFLRECNWGLDPGSFMTLSLSRFTNINFGIFSIIIYGAMLVIVVIFGWDLIGIGTLLNVAIIGNGSDLFLYIEKNLLDNAIFTDERFLPLKITIFVVSIALFVLGAAVYMRCNLGVAPYDALPIIAHKKLFPKAPFAVVRIIYDALVVMVGVAFCVKATPSLMKSTLGAFIMVPTVGPVITITDRFISRHIKFFQAPQKTQQKESPN